MSPERTEQDGLDGLRAELSEVRGQEFWRRLEELAAAGPLRDFLAREFPSQAPRFEADGVPRRDFLRLMGASLAVAGLGACTRQPDEKILPFASSPEWIIPGKPRYFATSMPLNGDALGLLVESHMGRPTKVEGNPDHPSSLGSTDGFAQAATLSLYDPDRSHSILRAGQIATWDSFLTEASELMDGIRAQRGEGLRLLVADSSSPTLAGQLRGLMQQLPRARWHQWTPVHDNDVRAGAQLAFGREVSTHYAFDRARVVLSLDSDFLVSGRSGVRNARGFARARKVRDESETMLRLYAVESSVSVTGAMADHRLKLKPSEVAAFTRHLARELGLEVPAPVVDERWRAFAALVADDLRKSSGASIVVPGDWCTPDVHALAHAINHRLLNAGTTVEHTEPAHPLAGGGGGTIEELVDEIRVGQVSMLVVLGGNPVYDAPADLDFATALQAVPFRAHLALHVDETSRLCNWHLPMAHFLEGWSDACAADGTTSVVQPLIAPLYSGRTAHELVATLGGRPGIKAYDLVREHWRASLAPDATDAEFESFWQRTLHDGLVQDSALPRLELSPREPLKLPELPGSTAGLEVAFRPDASTFDGRFANNAWLQETPRPLTRLTWDNAALVSPATAEGESLESGDIVTIQSGDRTVRAPVWITPGHPDGTLTLHLGYGRQHAGQLGDGVGFDAYRLRTSYAPWATGGVLLERTGDSMLLASVQDHARMEGRDLVRVKTFDRFAKAEHDSEGHHGSGDVSMYPGYEYEGNAWGMVIDLNACIGCNACMVACQSENNIPIVGKEEVSRGRELHWIRIDRYYEEDERGDEQVLHQPVPCMQCEQAPCEVVCPVGATVHNNEGLNDMVYNRCVGTRYCANNCPYKVRRFNFFKYADYKTESLKLGNNPDVTVRSRGIMEKCTYCVQRINETRITAKKEDRPIRDGEIKTACQQVCPTEAIAFGDISDDQTAVAKLRAESHHYALLEELGTRPRTTYLAKVTNPNPDGKR